MPAPSPSRYAVVLFVPLARDAATPTSAIWKPAMKAACVCCGLVAFALAGCTSKPAIPSSAAAKLQPADTRLDAGEAVSSADHADDQTGGWLAPILASTQSLGETLAGMTPGDGYAPDFDPAPSGMATWSWATVGATRSDRPIRAADVTGPTVGTGKRVYLIASIHGNEPEGRRGLELIAREIEAAARASAITLRVVDDANPDGTARGSRGNSLGIDLNRNWPARNFEPAPSRGPSPLSEPETRALAADLDAFKPDLVIVLHSIASGPFVNHDGPAIAIAAAFADGAVQADKRWRVVPNMGYPTPGSLGSFLGGDQGVAVLTIEFKRGQNARSASHALSHGLPRVFEALAAPVSVPANAAAEPVDRTSR